VIRNHLLFAFIDISLLLNRNPSVS
jgi:hypothetical protein